MTKTYDVYESKVHVLELDTIPETGDETFSVGAYPILVWNCEMKVDQEGVKEFTPHIPGSRGAIGVVGTKTVLVDVECNKESRGLTVRELAQFMIHILGCKTVSLTPFEPILVYTGFMEGEQEEVVESTEPVEEVVKPKRKRKGDSDE